MISHGYLSPKVVYASRTPGREGRQCVASGLCSQRVVWDPLLRGGTRGSVNADHAGRHLVGHGEHDDGGLRRFLRSNLRGPFSGFLYLFHSRREIQFVKGAAVSEEVLERANVREADSVLILARKPGDPTSDAESFATSSIVEQIDKEVGHNIKTVVELVSRKNARMMERAQPDSVVASDGISDLLLVQELLSPGSHHIFEQLITNQHGCEFHTTVTKLRDVRVIDAQIAILQHASDIQLIGLLRNDEPLLNPSKATLIEENDLLIVLSENPGAFAAIEDEIIATLSNLTNH